MAAKSKAELLKDAQSAGLAAADADADSYTVAQLEGLLGGDIPVHERKSADKPVVAADGHVVLSQEDIDARG